MTKQTKANNNVIIDVVMTESNQDNSTTQTSEAKRITLAETVSGARTDVASGYAAIGSAERNYAILLNTFFSNTGIVWFTLSNAQMKLTPEGKELAVEKKAFYADLKAKKHSNPATVWQRITQQYAVDDAQARSLFGFEPIQKAPEGHVGEEGEGEAKPKQRATRSPELRNIEELTALFKFNRSQESLTDKLNTVQTHIVAALAAMGIDVGSIE